jgi:hypothetical protein
VKLARQELPDIRATIASLWDALCGKWRICAVVSLVIDVLATACSAPHRDQRWRERAAQSMACLCLSGLVHFLLEFTFHLSHVLQAHAPQ